MEILTLADAGTEEAVEKSVRVLQGGGLVLLPTDTVYGLATDATNPDALARLRALKGREKGKPISVIVPSIASIREYGVMDEAAEALAERFFPGPLTLVMEATSLIPEELTLGGAIGIRIPDDAFCLALARVFRKPYTATSANRSGEETLGTVAEILGQFGDHAERIDLVIDAGALGTKKPSTVIATIDGSISVLREGALSRAALGL